MKTFMFWLLAACCAVPAAARPSAPFVFAVVSDVHCESYDPRTAAKYAAALRDAYKAGAKAMVVVGDASDGLEEDYKALRAVTAASPLAGKVRYAIGNHEYQCAFHDKAGDWKPETFPNGQTDAAARARFNALRGAPPAAPVYYDEHIHGYHFIFLGGEASDMTSPGTGDAAVLSPGQLAWFKRKLSADAPGAPVFVFLHQPFPGTVAGSSDGSASIKQAAELKAVLAAHPGVLFFSGHSHYRLSAPGAHYTGASYKFDMYNCSSVWEPYGTDNRPLEGNFSEGYIVKAGPDGVKVLGRDFVKGEFIKDASF